MKNNIDLKSFTTLKINKELLNICENKNIKIIELIRGTFQFLFIIDSYIDKDINKILKEIAEEYDIYEYKPLSNETKLVKTHLTKKQYDAYKKINHADRLFYFNKLMSIVINNTSYSYSRDSKLISRDPIINKFTIHYFTNKLVNREVIMVIMESLLTKMSHILDKQYIPDAFYKNLYSDFFNKSEAEEIYNQKIRTEFLLEEFKKIYFSMLIIFDIPSSSKSSRGFARNIKKKYKNIYVNKYNKDIDLFIKNEIEIFTNISHAEQLEEVMYIVTKLHPSFKEQEIVKLSFLPHFIL